MGVERNCNSKSGYENCGKETLDLEKELDRSDRSAEPLSSEPHQIRTTDPCIAKALIRRQPSFKAPPATIFAHSNCATHNISRCGRRQDYSLLCGGAIF